MTEKVLNAENWRNEATAVINDIRDHVNNIELSDRLGHSDQRIFLNLTTKEQCTYCLELSGVGFRIVGDRYDTNNLTNDEWFETPYSLLNKISPMFNASFGNELVKKLTDLNN